MRILTDTELALVAGGNASSDSYDNDGLGGMGWGDGTGGSGGGYGSGGTYVWMFSPGSVTTDPDGTPVVTASGGHWEYMGSTSDAYYGGSGMGGGGEQYAQWQGWVLGAVGDFIANLLADRAQNASEREARISNTFNPNDVVRNIQGMDRNGQIDRGWEMSDGSAFFDTDGNGTPDYHLWTDPAGNVWADEGDGRHLVRGAG